MTIITETDGKGRHLEIKNEEIKYWRHIWISHKKKGDTLNHCKVKAEVGD